jgi:hypothetical protein
MKRCVNPESLEALESRDKERLRAITLTYIQNRRERGATADEICAALGMVHNSIAPRVSELKSRGIITELYDASGKRVRRKTRQGCAAGVFVVSEHGREDLKAPCSLFGSLSPESCAGD